MCKVKDEPKNPLDEQIARAEAKKEQSKAVNSKNSDSVREIEKTY